MKRWPVIIRINSHFSKVHPTVLKSQERSLRSILIFHSYPVRPKTCPTSATQNCCSTKPATLRKSRWHSSWVPTLIIHQVIIKKLLRKCISFPRITESLLLGGAEGNKSKEVCVCVCSLLRFSWSLILQLSFMAFCHFLGDSSKTMRQTPYQQRGTTITKSTLD